MSARKKMGLPLQMGIGMVLGILMGTLAPKLGISAAFFKPFGDLFINLVRMGVVPLVLATLVSGAASVGDVGRLGRVAAKTLVFYFATTALAVAIGLVLGNIFQPGVGLDLSTANLSAKEVAAPSLVQVLMGIVPLNPVDALAKGNILQIIFFAVLVGMAISLCGDKAKPAAAFFDAMSEVMIRVTSMVMHYAPIGVFALRACLETSAFIVTRRHVDKKRLCAAAKTREDCQTVPQRSDGQRMGACTSSPAPCFWRRSEAQNRPA